LRSIRHWALRFKYEFFGVDLNDLIRMKNYTAFYLTSLPDALLLPDKIQDSIDDRERVWRAAGDKQIDLYSI
jgi:hypothetical protein